MSDSNRTPDSGKKEPQEDFKSGARPWLIWLAILGAIPLLILFRNQNEVKVRVLSYPEFIQKVEKKLIRNGIITYNPQTSDLREITGTFVEVDSNEKPRMTAEGKELEMFEQLFQYWIQAHLKHPSL